MYGMRTQQTAGCWRDTLLGRHSNGVDWSSPAAAAAVLSMQGYETALQLALHNGHVIVATHAQDPSAPMPTDEIDGPG